VREILLRGLSSSASVTKKTAAKPHSGRFAARPSLRAFLRPRICWRFMGSGVVLCGHAGVAIFQTLEQPLDASRPFAWSTGPAPAAISAMTRQEGAVQAPVGVVRMLCVLGWLAIMASQDDQRDPVARNEGGTASLKAAPPRGNPPGNAAIDRASLLRPARERIGLEQHQPELRRHATAFDAVAAMRPGEVG
jgi:hypothetical protein